MFTYRSIELCFIFGLTDTGRGYVVECIFSIQQGDTALYVFVVHSAFIIQPLLSDKGSRLALQGEKLMSKLNQSLFCGQIMSELSG